MNLIIELPILVGSQSPIPLLAPKTFPLDLKTRYPVSRLILSCFQLGSMYDLTCNRTGCDRLEIVKNEGKLESGLVDVRCVVIG
jgi:hypothetical protein